MTGANDHDGVGQIGPRAAGEMIEHAAKAHAEDASGPSRGYARTKQTQPGAGIAPDWCIVGRVDFGSGLK